MPNYNSLLARNDITVVTAVHLRPLVTHLFLSSLKEIEVDLHIAGSDEQNKKVFDRFDNSHWHWHWIDNSPVSDKFNKLISRIRGYEWYFIVNSDTLFTEALLKRMLGFGVEYVRLHDLYFFDIRNLWCWHFEGYGKGWPNESLGTCRLLNWELVKRHNFQLWKPGRMSGLDKSMTAIIEPETDKKIRLEEEFACDIKSHTNIWDTPSYGGKPEMDIKKLITKHYDFNYWKLIQKVHNLYKRYNLMKDQKLKVKVLHDFVGTGEENDKNGKVREGRELKMKKWRAEKMAESGYVQILERANEPKVKELKTGKETKEEKNTPETKEEKSLGGTQKAATPKARKLIRDNDLKDSEIEGTGKNGKITVKDVRDALGDD